MLARLGIRQKLSLLLMIPLAAVVLVMVPFTAERIGDARSAQTTARTALAARDIGALIQTIQQERLTALGYLSSPNLDRAALVAQGEAASDAAARLATDPLTSQVMVNAARELGALAAIRRDVVDRMIGAQAAYEGYRAATSALLDALRLNRVPGADAQGLAQLGALDALMRSNEELTGAGAILVAAAGELDVDHELITSALTAQRQYLDQFGRLVSGEQVEFVESVDSGEASARFAAMVRNANSMMAGGPTVEVAEALTAAVSYTGLRRFAQDRVAREIAVLAEQRASAALTTAVSVVTGAVTVFGVVLALGVTVSRSISRPLRRLTRAAAVVAEVARTELVRVSDSESPDPEPPRLASIDVSSVDEIGELAAALNRVQATAALLLERQVSTRSNVAVMFANIARRTQNLVGRQLSLIDELERDERNPDLLRRLYRVDHIATRLRRSADSLLVVSGTVDQEMSGAPIPLLEVIRSALAEIEGFRAVELGDVVDVAVNASLAADLRLMLAELIENATNFSPPGIPVLVTADLRDECRIMVVDHGMGMSATRLREENRRLVDRERLDVAPTSVLGLFVVGRLARRHGLVVRLDPSEGRGVTASIRVPIYLLSVVTGARGDRLAPFRVRQLPPEIEAIEAIEAGPRGPFGWFASQDGRRAIAAVAEPSAVRSVGRASVSWVPQAGQEPSPDQPGGRAGGPSGSGLGRRIPGAHLTEVLGTDDDEPSTERLQRDPNAEREAMNDYASGVARAEGAAQPAPTSGSTHAERHS